MGYRDFESFDMPVRYGFGFGLSYTDFQIAPEQISIGDDGVVSVEARVRNVGTKFAGSEAAQLCVSLPEGRLEKESRRLCASTKMKRLAPRRRAGAGAALRTGGTGQLR